MSMEVIAAVLFGALLHALWNTLAKRNAGRAGDAVVVGIMAGVPAALTLPLIVLPLNAAWPQIIASAIIHVGYFKVLAGAYRGGDLSVAYPLMRAGRRWSSPVRRFSCLVKRSPLRPGAPCWS